MIIPVTLHATASGTDVHAVHEGVPSGVSSADNETGWNMALANLAALVDGGQL